MKKLLMVSGLTLVFGFVEIACEFDVKRGIPPDPAVPVNYCQARCTSDLGCDANEFCDQNGMCVECLEDNQCTLPATTCDEGKCIECQADSDCTDDSAKSRCGKDGFCICAKNEDCTVAGLGLCRNTGCVCSSDDGCIGTVAQTCYFGLCIDCAEDTHCTSGKCYSPGSADSFCGCDEDADCVGDESGPFCCLDDGDPDTPIPCPEEGECFECQEDADCTEPGKSKCSDNVCGCMDNSDCQAAQLGNTCESDGSCSCEALSECAVSPGQGKTWVCEE